ncbi:sensor domain-containing phosphodiesterase [Mycolicibacterium sp.]|uniref:sensor domain-containing phosphodiesterase n=1 Tax=Mycolicibacterium sp. TaxID=2320850 RepID=UPI003D1213F8
MLNDAISGKGLVTAYQRVVALPSEEIVGYEALARFPERKNVTPLDILGHAKSTGQLALLDHACVREAARGALKGNSAPGMLLLVNSEPATAYADLSKDLDVMRAAETFRLVFEITERGLFTDLRALLRKVAVLRSLGIGIAMDDIGAHPDSLALLDVIAPDIVKLDIGMVQSAPSEVQVHTIAAILAYHERTNAMICAEGIETDEHLEQALACGATLGQGYKFGAAEELTVSPSPFAWPGPGELARPETDSSVFHVTATGQQTRTVHRRELIELIQQVQQRAATAETPPIVLSALGGEELGEQTRRRYRDLAEKSPLVAVFGHHIPAGLGDRVRKVRLDKEDPLADEVSIVVLGPDTAAGVVAREKVTTSQSNGDRLYDVVSTEDRDRAAAAVRSLLERPMPMISVRVDARRRKLASCTCGWTAKWRRLWFMALGDVSDHQLKTGHMPLDLLEH